MADTTADTANHTSSGTRTTDPTLSGNWQTVEQAAVALGLSVRTVNRHISAQKLRSRLMDGRREVFVASPDEGLSEPRPTDSETSNATASPSAPSSATPVNTDPSPHTMPEKDGDQPSGHLNSFLDLDTALAMADRKADRQVELAVRAYQSLTQTIEGQAHHARKTARFAWCVVGVLAIGTTTGLVWTATRVTQAESDSQHLKRQADDLDKRAADSEKKLADMQEKLSQAEQARARAEGRYEEMQSHQPASQPATRPTTQSLIDRLTNAFNPTGQ